MKKIYRYPRACAHKCITAFCWLAVLNVFKFYFAAKSCQTNEGTEKVQYFHL